VEEAEQAEARDPTMTTAPLRLLGTTTSPYVRRVRIVAAELGQPIELVDTSAPEGLAELTRTSPIWKVPVAVFGADVVFDSHAIVARLRREAALRADGSLEDQPLRPFDPTDAQQQNLVLAIDGALDALIQWFYLRRNGVEATTPYLVRQQDRARACLTWLSSELPTRAETGLGDDRLDWIEVALATALAWMRFRSAYPVDDHPRLVAILDRLDARPSFVVSRPG
jgi:glutathione S-transferase